MLWTITAREILDNLMSMKFLFGTVLCLALIVTSTVVSLQNYQSRMDEYESAIAEFNEKPDILRVRIHPTKVWQNTSVEFHKVVSKATEFWSSSLVYEQRRSISMSDRKTQIQNQESEGGGLWFPHSERWHRNRLKSCKLAMRSLGWDFMALFRMAE